MRTLTSIAAAVVLALGVAACGAASPTTTTPEPAAQSTSAPKATTAPKATVKPAPAKPAAPKLTKEQQNALESAQNYLDSMGFSKKGLIEQVVFEGYSKTDATKAVALLSVNWNREAAEAAKAYLDSQPFSRKGLIEQLKFEGFTTKQAAYGATKAGL